MPDLKFDTIQVGSVANILQFLKMDKAQGCVKFEFGFDLPPAFVNYVLGKVTTAEFGVIYGDQVLCLLMCQESSLKTIEFVPHWHHGNPYEKSRAVSDPELSGSLVKVVQGMDTCTVRPSLFGKQKIQFVHSGKSSNVLQVLHDFDMVREIFQTEPVVSFAPVHQCALFQKALTMGLIEYQEKYVPLSDIKPLLHLLKPLPQRDYDILVESMHRLLPHPKANAVSLEAAMEFFDLLEACSDERGREIHDSMQFKIFQLLSEKTGMDLFNVTKFRQQKLLERLMQKKQPREQPIQPGVAPQIPVIENDFDILKIAAKKNSEAKKSQPSFMQLFFGSQAALSDRDGRGLSP